MTILRDSKEAGLMAMKTTNLNPMRCNKALNRHGRWYGRGGGNRHAFATDLQYTRHPDFIDGWQIVNHASKVCRPLREGGNRRPVRPKQRFLG